MDDSDEDLFPDIGSVEDDDDDEPLTTNAAVIQKKLPSFAARTIPPPREKVVVAQRKQQQYQVALPEYVRLEDEKTLVSHAAWLSSQEYNDDLKFVNFDLIDFERLGIVVEQDRTLGKGGHVWDGSFVLAENLNKSFENVLELGAGGTGLAGLAYAKKFPAANVVLSEGDESLLPLLERNIARNGLDKICRARRILWRRRDLKDGESDGDFWMPPQVENDEVIDDNFDLILAAECVAPIYDPQALVDTLCRFSHDRTEIWLLGKDGRWPEHAKHVYDHVISKHFDICTLEQPNSLLTAPYYKLAILKPRFDTT